MGVQERQMTIPAVLNELAALCDFVVDAAQTAGLSEDAVYHCHLSVEEVCTNVIEHGYNFEGEDGQISVLCRAVPSQFVITVIDTAPPFNPLELPDPDPSTPLWEREGGGWGIYFVRQYMDEVSYQYKDSKNHFTMVKKY